MLQVYGTPWRLASATARYCRRQVIGAKDRAKCLAVTPRSTPERRTQKEEMVQWMLVWLENPEVFPAWVDARKKTIQPPMNADERG